LREWDVPLDAINNYMDAILQRNLAQANDLMRRIGRAPILAHRPDLWRQAYDAYLAVLWPHNQYHVGDETRLLRGESLP